MLKRAAVLTVSVISLALSACDDVDADRNLIESALKWNQLGYSPDYWLEQYAPYRNEWDRVALVFGYGNDHEECIELVNLLVQKRPRAQYRCASAN